MVRGRAGWRVPRLVAAGLCLAAGSWAASQGEKPEAVSRPKAPREARKQWEYRQVTICPGPEPGEEVLNRVGEEGWELVILTANPPGRQECHLATFKRERLR